MLAKPAATLPAVGGLLGGTVYEPKWDGYRAILERTSAGCRVWSRKGADLAAGFPEIVQAALEQLEPGTVIDGELVVWRDGRLDFGHWPRGWHTAAAAGRGRTSHLPPSWLSTSWLQATSTCGPSRCAIAGQCSSSWRDHGSRRCS